MKKDVDLLTFDSETANQLSLMRNVGEQGFIFHYVVFKGKVLIYIQSM
jgi:hypothetical protein